MASSQITLVDSHDDARESLHRILQAEGFQIQSLADGWSAWNVLRDKPELVIVDLDLKRIDGLQLARRLRTRHGSVFPLLALSCARGPALLSQIRSAGFDDCWFKPYAPAELVEWIRRHLAARSLAGNRNRRRAA